MQHEDWIDKALAQRREDGLLRRDHLREGTRARTVCDQGVRLNFTTNDYLGLSRHPALAAAAREAASVHGTGATASRLVGGTLPLHRQLEERLCAFKGSEAALVFGSGFLTSLGLIGAVVGRGDTVVADRLAHASLLDGARASGARLQRFRHNDPEDAARLLQEAKGRRLLVTESVFSMDGDLAPLAELVQVAETQEAMLLVDEAHATGVFGPHGAGRIAEAGLVDRVNLGMGTLSKALGGYGGFVGCSVLMREFLVNHARAFIYTTAPPPSVLAAGLAALEVCRREPERAQRVRELAERFRARLREEGFDVGASESPIVPVHVGDNQRAVDWAATLAERGIDVVAIRPPTVPAGTARLRFSWSAEHAPSDVERVVDALKHTREAAA